MFERARELEALLRITKYYTAHNIPFTRVSEMYCPKVVTLLKTRRLTLREMVSQHHCSMAVCIVWFTDDSVWNHYPKIARRKMFPL